VFKFFIHICLNLCPKIFSAPEAKNMILGQAADLKVADVLHTALARLFAKTHEIGEFNTRTERLALLAQSLKRHRQSKDLIDFTDIHSIPGILILCLLIDLIEDCFDNKIETSQIIPAYDDKLQKLQTFITSLLEDDPIKTNQFIFKKMQEMGMYEGLMNDLQSSCFLEFCLQKENKETAIPLSDLGLAEYMPFQIFSSSVGLSTVDEKIRGIFPAKWAVIAFQRTGRYEIEVESTGDASFSSHNTYGQETLKVSNIRVTYAKFFKGVFSRDKASDSYSVSGMMFAKHGGEKKSYKAIKPLQIIEDKNVFLTVVFTGKKTHLFQHQELFCTFKRFGDLFPAIEAQNCICTISFLPQIAFEGEEVYLEEEKY
jgi:hypothetical protein